MHEIQWYLGLKNQDSLTRSHNNKCTLPETNMAGWKMDPEWRCICYWTWGYIQPAIWLLQSLQKESQVAGPPTRVLRLPPKRSPPQDEPLLYSYKWSYKVITTIKGLFVNGFPWGYFTTITRGVITNPTYFSGFFGTHFAAFLTSGSVSRLLPCAHMELVLVVTWRVDRIFYKSNYSIATSHDLTPRGS